LNRLQAHDDHILAVFAHELNSTIEPGEVDYSRDDEGVQNRAPARHHLVVWRIDDELFGPESFQGWNVTMQRGNALLVIKCCEQNSAMTGGVVSAVLKDDGFDHAGWW